MAILCNVSDRHLYAPGNNYTRSSDPYSITVWINAIWSTPAILSLVGLYNGGLLTPLPTTGLQIGSRSSGLLTVWTYGGVILAQSAPGQMTGLDNTWVCITYTYDGTTHRIYRNDTLLAATTTPVVDGVFTQVYINGYPPTGTVDETSTHQVDSYAYYNRQLSQQEIQTISNSRGSRHGIVDGLLARFDFDELSQGSTVVTVADVSGNGHTMLNTGAGNAITYTYTNTLANANLRPVQ